MLTLASLLILGLAEYLRRQRNGAAWVLMILISALGFFTLPLMLVPFGAIWVWLAISWRRSDIEAAYQGTFGNYLLLFGLATVLLTGLLYLPVLVEEGPGKFASTAAGWSRWFARYLDLVGLSLETALQHWIRDLPILLWVLLGLGFIAHFFAPRQQNKPRTSFALVFLLWSIFVFSVLRSAPAHRILLFMLPLILLWSSYGLLVLLNRIVDTSQTTISLVIVVIAILLPVVIGIDLVRENRYLTSDQVLENADQIALDLKNILSPGDIVLARVRTDVPLRYNFKLQGIPSGHVIRPHSDPSFGRAFILTWSSPGETVERVVRFYGMENRLAIDSAELVQRYPTAVLYEIWPDDDAEQGE